MSARLTIQVPEDYVLARDVCSYGYFLLEPNHWDPDAGSFRTTIDLGTRAVTVRIVQQGSEAEAAAPRALGKILRLRGKPLVVHADVKLDRDERTLLMSRLSRMLVLDTQRSTLKAFHTLDPRFKKSGRGRLMRSPTFFEDVIKTVTSCNVQWPSTIVMNRRLCVVAGSESASGRNAFPTPEAIARMRPANLRARCRLGYRDARVVELARMFVRGEIDSARMEDPSRPHEEVYEELLEWPGIGPYAAANIMQLLGRYARLPLDTESVRHGRTVLGFTGTSNQVMRRVHAHFEPMGEHKFRSYWFELWEFYERKHGPSWTWKRETTGTQFTASKLVEKPSVVAKL